MRPRTSRNPSGPAALRVRGIGSAARPESPLAALLSFPTLVTAPIVQKWNPLPIRAKAASGVPRSPARKPHRLPRPPRPRPRPALRAFQKHRDEAKGTGKDQPRLASGTPEPSLNCARVASDLPNPWCGAVSKVPDPATEPAQYTLAPSPIPRFCLPLASVPGFWAGPGPPVAVTTAPMELPPAASTHSRGLTPRRRWSHRQRPLRSRCRRVDRLGGHSGRFPTSRGTPPVLRCPPRSLLPSPRTLPLPRPRRCLPNHCHCRPGATPLLARVPLPAGTRRSCTRRLPRSR